jgi:hypothetical protein
MRRRRPRPIRITRPSVSEPPAWVGAARPRDGRRASPRRWGTASSEYHVSGTHGISQRPERESHAPFGKAAVVRLPEATFRPIVGMPCVHSPGGVGTSFPVPVIDNVSGISRNVVMRSGPGPELVSCGSRWPARRRRDRGYSCASGTPPPRGRGRSSRACTPPRPTSTPTSGGCRTTTRPGGTRLSRAGRPGTGVRPGPRGVPRLIVHRRPAQPAQLPGRPRPSPGGERGHRPPKAPEPSAASSRGRRRGPGERAAAVRRGVRPGAPEGRRLSPTLCDFRPPSATSAPSPQQLLPAGASWSSAASGSECRGP